MTSVALDILETHSARILAALSSGDFAVLPRLMDDREELIHKVLTSLQGQRVDPARIEALMVTEARIRTALAAERDAVWTEIQRLQAGKAATRGYYGGTEEAPARYLDRAG